MANKTAYDVLENLAEEYIPEGKHKLLHINSRAAWLTMMKNLLRGGFVDKKYLILKKCAINWEALLAQKYSIQN
jgi:hypothetical protein